MKKINTHKPSFDLRTHVRDGKGKIAQENHYRLTIENGVKKFERPPGSGYIYDEAGKLIQEPKPGQTKKITAKEEFSNDGLAKQLEELKQKLALAEEKLAAAVKEESEEEPEEIPAALVDNSEEIKLMEQAGAVDQALLMKEAAKQTQPLFKKQNLVK